VRGVSTAAKNRPSSGFPSARDTGDITETTRGLPDAATVLSQARSENFPVALWAVGPRLRGDLMALYGFARLVDDTGDEVSGDRLALLDRLERELDDPRHPLMVRLSETIAGRELPREPFLRLIEANRRDQALVRFESRDELWDYCMLSAAPIGEIVLYLTGQANPERIALSDRVCAALQVIEHLQDVEEDAARGRSYIGDFDAHAYAAELLRSGPPLVRSLRGRARIAVAGFLAGGRVALAGLESHPDGLAFAPQFARAVAGR
jgi:phytoene/squalene synthetase